MADLAPARAAHGPRLASGCLLYTSDAADERSSVDLGGRRIIKKKNKKNKSIERHRAIKEKNSRNEAEDTDTREKKATEM